MHLSRAKRIEGYTNAFPKFPSPILENGRISGMWIMGNNYTTSGYYGAYPHGYLARVMSMFPDAKRVLHVPSGSLPPGNYVRIDSMPVCSPDILGDCHNLLALVGDSRFDLIMVDPPYSCEDAEHYGTPMIRRNALLESCLSVLQLGGWIVWLDQAFPMFSKSICSLALTIGMVKSTNHRFRVVLGFEKLGGVFS